MDKIKVADQFVVDPDSEGDNTVVEIESDHCSPFLAKKKNLNQFIACLKSRSHVKARQASDVRAPTKNGIAKSSAWVTEFTKTFLSHPAVRPEATSPHEPQGPAVGSAALQARIRPFVPWGNQECNGAGDSPLRVQKGNLYLFEQHEDTENAVMQLDMDPCERLILGPFSEHLDCLTTVLTFVVSFVQCLWGPQFGSRLSDGLGENDGSILRVAHPRVYGFEPRLPVCTCTD